MPAPASPLELLHPCLRDPRPSSPLATAVLSERERIGVLLEGVAIDAHLGRVGRRPAPRWDGARISPQGRLVAVVAVTDQGTRTTAAETAVDRALFLARVLFPERGGAERGTRQRSARELVLRWTIGPPTLAADELVRDVLEQAPFLWGPRFARYRESLAAVVREGDGDRLAVAGPAPFRRRAIERSGSPPALAALLRGDAARSLWSGVGGGADESFVLSATASTVSAAASTTTRATASTGATAATVATAPSGGVLDRLAALHRAGGWRAVVSEAQRLRRDGDDRGAELEIARRAVDACLHQWQFERAAQWAAWAVERASSRDASSARLLAAWVRHETRETGVTREPRAARATSRPRALTPRPPSDVVAAAAAADEAPLAGDGSIEPLLLWSRIETERRPAAVAARLAAVLADRSWRAPIDRGRLWLELGRARRAFEEQRLGGDVDPVHSEPPSTLDAAAAPSSAPTSCTRRAWYPSRPASDPHSVRVIAERAALQRTPPESAPLRAFTHALRHLRRGDHRIELWRAAAALLGERVCCGALARAGRVAAGLSEWAATDGDRRRELEAAVLAVRVEIASGDLDRAAQSARSVLDDLPPRCRDRSRGELEMLLGAVRSRLAVATDDASPPRAPRLDQQMPDRGIAPIAPAIAGGAGPDRARSPSIAAGAARDGIVGESRALDDALRRLERLARGDLPVLLSGETGTGKELAAKRLHQQSSRRDRPLVAVNCAALSESLLLSELFGHARGAFTGADRDRAGVFETAHGGAVFLDEIGDLPGGAQGALLRVLQEGEVRRVGESRPRRVDVRVVAATHRDLAALVERGAFRHDLYYRLNVAVVRLPPLRERGEDVLLLARHFLAAGQPSLALARDAEEVLLAWSWPGNVRELRSVVQVAAAMHEGAGWLRARDLELPASPPPPGPSYRGALDAERRRLLEQALSAAGGRRSEAAKRLGITPQAVSYLVRRLGLGAG